MRLMFGDGDQEQMKIQEEMKVQEEKKTKIELGSFKRQVGKSTLDVDESEETTKQRAIVPLDYTVGDNENHIYNNQDEDHDDEELGVKRNARSGTGNMQAALEQARQHALKAAMAQSKALEIASKLASSNAVSATSAYPSSLSADEKAKMRQKELVDSIPTERSALFAYAIDWGYVDKSPLLNDVIRPWVSKKVIEYLEEDEPTLVSFILSKMRSHCSPMDLIQELQPVLDEDAEQFVVKMWRFLIFSVLKAIDNI